MKKVVCFLLLFVLLGSFAAISASADSFSLTKAEKEFPFPAGQTLWYRFVCGAPLSWDPAEIKDLKAVLRNCDQLPVEGGCTRDVFYVFYPDGQDPSDPKTPLSYWRYSPRFGFNDDVERYPEMMRYFQQNGNRGKEILRSVGVDAEIREVVLYHEINFGAYVFYVSDRGVYTLCRDFERSGSDESYLFPEDVFWEIAQRRVAKANEKISPPYPVGDEWTLTEWGEYRIDLSALPEISAGTDGTVPAETGTATGGQTVVSPDAATPAPLKIAVAVVTVGLIVAALWGCFRKGNGERGAAEQ